MNTSGIESYEEMQLRKEIDRLRAALSERDRMLGDAARIIRAYADNKFATDTDKFGFVRVLDGETFLSAYYASKNAAPAGKGGE